MKKNFILILSVFLLLTISSCRTIFRDYQDNELESLAISEFNFDSYEVFKVIDVFTANYLTTRDYQNSGIIIGIKDGDYRMIFVPKKVSEDPFILQNTSYFNLEEIYVELENFIEESMFLEDYGSLSVTTDPYYDILESNPSLHFDSKIFFIVRTDENAFYANYMNASLLIFDTEYNLIYSQIQG
jgi:hypothetical protein